jgi:hypothetical protein
MKNRIGSGFAKSGNRPTTGFFNHLSVDDTDFCQMPSASLSSQGLERAASISESAFVFIGNNCEFRCTQFQAAFISPRVHGLLQQDATVNSFCLDHDGDQMSETRMFDILEQLVNGWSIEVGRCEVGALEDFASLLGNAELLRQFLDEDGPMTQTNVCRRLKHKFSIGVSASAELEFAASHFHELEEEDLKELDISVIEAILNSGSLRLITEDSLLNFILSLDWAEQLLAVRYIRAEYLTIESMASLVSRLADSDFDLLVWTSLCRRLCLPGAFGLVESREGTLQFRMNPARPLDGIIRYLTTKHGGNVHTHGIVQMTSASDDWRSLWNVANLEGESPFWSDSRTGQWICWNFGEMRVRATHYTIRAYGLRSWVGESSLDGEVWTEIDRQTDNLAFTRNVSTASFSVSNPVESRFIRLTHTGPRQDGDRWLCWTGVEFFGTLSA